MRHTGKYLIQSKKNQIPVAKLKIKNKIFALKCTFFDKIRIRKKDY